MNQVIESLAYFWDFSEYTEDKHTQFSLYRACSSTLKHAELLHFASQNYDREQLQLSVFQQKRDHIPKSDFNYCFKLVSPYQPLCIFMHHICQKKMVSEASFKVFPQVKQ